MKYKLFGVLVCLVIEFCFFDWAMAENQGISNQKYVGISYNYATETNWLFKHSDYVNYESQQLRCYAGNKFKGSYRVEWEFIIANIKEQGDTKKEEILYGIETGILYDLLPEFCMKI